MSIRSFQTPSSLVNVMAKAVLKAAQSLRRDFGEVEHLQISLKGPRDFVSAADKKAEHVLYRELSKARPEFGFLMEEGGAIQGRENTTWIIDPLDGTSNFIHGLPHFCISVGVLKDNVPVAGVIYDPLRDEMFWAEKGGGAFMNEQKLHVSRRQDLSLGLWGVSHYPVSSHAQGPSLFRETSVRMLGSAALDLAYVAAGRLDGFAGRHLKCWDVVAGIVLVKEALGTVTDWEGGGFDVYKGEVLASNGLMAPKVLELLRRDRLAGPEA